MSDNPIKITIEAGFYAMRSPQDHKLIAELKNAIHYSKRTWTGSAWLVDPSVLNSLLLAIERAGYARPDVPAMESSNAIQATVRKTVRIEYLGQCKERDHGAVTAMATSNAVEPYMDRDGNWRYNWSIEVLESALKDWFEKAPVEAVTGQTLYQTLCIFESVSPQEIKSAYRRLSRQWHPDVCSEPNAAEMFKSLSAAYEILGDPIKRKRYDAGLFFEREALRQKEADAESVYEAGHFFMAIRGRRGGKKFVNLHFIAPLRCGVLTVEGRQELKKFIVTKILAWDDITENGMTMTSSWRKATQSIRIEWI